MLLIQPIKNQGDVKLSIFRVLTMRCLITAYRKARFHSYLVPSYPGTSATEGVRFPKGNLPAFFVKPRGALLSLPQPPPDP